MKADTRDWRGNDIISQLSRTLRAANAYIAELLASEGISGLVPSHGDILMCLLASDEPIAMASLAGLIGKDPSTVTTLVKKLAEAGYVSLRKSEADRRVTLTQLTEKGRALGAGVERINRVLLDTAAAGVPVGDLARTRATLATMQDNFDKARKEL